MPKVKQDFLILEWISDLLAFTGVVLNTVVLNKVVLMGSQWAILNAKVVYDAYQNMQNLLCSGELIPAAHALVS